MEKFDKQFIFSKILFDFNKYNSVIGGLKNGKGRFTFKG
jgi:hypothetical protein